jgi:hypothetical protein
MYTVGCKTCIKIKVCLGEDMIETSVVSGPAIDCNADNVGHMDSISTANFLIAK